MRDTTSLFASHSVRSLQELLRKRRITPVEIADECCARVRQLDPRYKVMVAHDPSLVRAAARLSAEKLRSGVLQRPLEAIPVGVKDIFNTAEYPTQMGSPLWKGFTPGNDARTVFYVKQAGGIVSGKTVTAEFAVHTLGPTMNPHDMALTPGTSSSGSAAGVALGMFPVSLGTQTAGSIVRPASFCGVFGCKPSFGLIPRTGMLKTTDSLDTVGFFTYHAEDMRRVFEVLRVHGMNYPMSHAALNDPARRAKPARRPWRIAFCKTHTWKNAPQYAREAIAAFADKLGAAKGIEVSEVALPAVINRSHEVHAAIYNKTLSYYFSGEFNRHELVSPIMNDLILKGRATSVAVYQRALRQQEDIAAAMDGLLSRYDALISLGTAGEAPERHVEELPDPSLIWTLAQLPVVCVPQFRSPAGRPFGVQFAAKRYSDYLLFELIGDLAARGAIPVKSQALTPGAVKAR